MANPCAGLDPTWAHLPTPAPTHAAAGSHYYCSSSPAWLTSAAAFENEALTSALRASMAPATNAYHYSAAAASSFSCPATPSTSTTTSSASELLSASSGGGHDYAPAAPTSRSSRPGARALEGTRAGRVAKQRKPRPSRASRRPQTTYISADPANFRRMVQEITGLPVVPGTSSSFPAGAAVVAPNWTTPAPACELPTLDTSAFLLDSAAAAAAVPAPEDKKSPGGGHASSAMRGADVAVADVAGDDGSSALLELEALLCAAADGRGFPTLESWGMMIN